MTESILEEVDPIAGRPGWAADARLVHSILYSKLSALRLPSFAGEGLPERMRSIGFALLGLTAAAGLALVAIFAQLGFPVLAPAPLPDEPSASEAISQAAKLQLEHAAVAVLPARPAPAQPERGSENLETHAGGRPESPGGSSVGQVAPAEVDAPAPVNAPQPSSGSSGGGGAGHGTGGGSGPASTGAPEQPAAAPTTAASSPQPSAPQPGAIASAPKPEPAPAPGSSSSAAAAEHASERGIEASASSGPAASSAAAGPGDSSPPGNGKGLAKGLDK